MALVSNRFEVEVTWTESSGKSVNRTYRAIDTITTPAALATAWALALPFVQAMSDSVISQYVYKQVFVEDALVLPTDAENNDQALFTGKIAGDPTDSAIVSVPAASIGIFVTPTGGGRDVVDMSDAAVQAFVDLFSDGGTNGDWVISDGEQWSEPTVSGRRRNTKSTNS
jgi:hypothetical protein